MRGSLVARDVIARLNTLAFAVALLLLAALGVAWWRDRVQRYDTPRFEAARFEPIAPDSALARERWLVAVNLKCPHCTRHLGALRARIAARPSPPSLGAIIVDQPTRPAADALEGPLPGGVWWDRAQVWREHWGRRTYGETFRFAADGRMLSSTPVGVVPDSSGSRM